jgi:hypothetical protein
MGCRFAGFDVGRLSVIGLAFGFFLAPFTLVQLN